MHPRTEQPAQADLKETWLQAFAEHFTVSAACRATDIGRRTVYDWRQQDEEFALAWADIDSANVEEMEAEARRRAVAGVEKAVTIAGQREVIREYSNDLLMFLLRARRPELYRERMNVTHEGGDRPVQIQNGKADLTRLSRDDLKTLHDLVRRAEATDS